MRKWLRPLWFALALVILFESWVWDRCVALGHWLVDRLPMAALKRGIAAFIARLPPYAVLAVFALPVLIIEPFKFFGLYLLTHRHLFAGIAVFVAAKFVAVALIAFLFELCRDKLMQISWFPAFYRWFIWAWHWAHSLIDPVKAWAKALIVPLKARLAEWKAWVLAALARRRNGPLAAALRAMRARWGRARP